MSHTAYACSCIAPESPTEELEKHDAVFSGTAIEVTEVHPNAPIYSSADPVMVKFDVDTVWKGLDASPVVTIKTAQSSASCGYSFEEGTTYVVYADKRAGNLEVSLCSRTDTIWNASEDVEVLGTGLFDEVNHTYMMPPLKQLDSGVLPEMIHCRDSLVLVYKSEDKSPACVKSDTKAKLIERGWAKNTLDVDLSDYNDSDTPSQDARKTFTLDDFKKTLSKSQELSTIFSKYGQPYSDIGSGIHIYVYLLDDATQVWIGYADHVLYVRHMDANGNHLEQIFPIH